MSRIAPKLLIVAVATFATSAVGQEWSSAKVHDLLDKARSGDVTAQFELANAYDTGRGAPRDGKAAMHWYAAAATQGDAEAQNSLGSALQAEKKYAEARTWYEKASAQNHARASNNLAYLYDLGLGVKQDRQQAFKLYAKAAELGSAEAMWNTANMYGAGQLGHPPDLLQACIWTLRARNFAGAEERQLLAQVKHVTPILEARLSDDQMNSCRDQARAWSDKKGRGSARRRFGSE